MKITCLILVILISIISLIVGTSTYSEGLEQHSPGGGVQREYTKKIKKPKPTKHSKYAKQVMDRNLLKRNKKRKD